MMRAISKRSIPLLMVKSMSARLLLEFVEHGIRLTEQRGGQLALLVRYTWIAGKRAAGLISSGPLDRVIVLTKRIQWFDMGAETNRAQHHHAWVVFDHAHPKGQPPALLFA